MRRLMTAGMLVSALSLGLYGQAMTEAAAAAAGSSMGSVAGQQVGQGLTNIFKSVTGATNSAARGGSKSSLVKVGPGVPKDVPKAKTTVKQSAAPAQPAPATAVAAVSTPAPSPAAVPAPPRAQEDDLYNVPPPPPLPSERRRPAPRPVQPVLPTPPAPVMTEAALRTVKAGMDRSELLKLGEPSARISMDKDGHFVEVFRYSSGRNPVGAVRLTDGAVSRVEVVVNQ